MSRWLSLVAGAALVVGVSGCNSPACGPGTKQVQLKNGDIQCQLADVPAQGIPCDTSAGASIVGGKCVSTIMCGQNTTLENGVCVGSGGGGLTAPPCGKPTAGNVCVNGLIRDFLTNAVYTTTKMHVAIYNPLDFLAGMPPIADQKVAAGAGGYVFPNIAPPTIGLIAVVAGDDDLTTTNLSANFQTAASGAQGVAAGGSYQVDIYELPRTVVNGWKGAPNGSDWYTTGGYISRFFSDPLPDPTMLIANETSPVMGVKVTNPSGSMAPVSTTSVYFSTDLSTTDTTLKATSAIGAAITPPPAMNIANFSGMGGTDSTGAAINWETQSGGSAPHIIFISRFHPN